MNNDFYEQLDFFDKLTKHLEEINLPVDFDEQGKALSINLGNDQGRHLMLVVTCINDGSRLMLFTGFPFVPNSENWLSLNKFSSYLCYSKAVAARYDPKDSQRLEIVLSTDIYDAYEPSEQVYYSIFNLLTPLQKLTAGILTTAIWNPRTKRLACLFLAPMVLRTSSAPAIECCIA